MTLDLGNQASLEALHLLIASGVHAGSAHAHFWKLVGSWFESVQIASSHLDMYCLFGFSRVHNFWRLFVLLNL